MNRAEQALAGVGTVALVASTRPLWWIIQSDFTDDVVNPLSAGTIATYLRELFIETDFVFAFHTALAWIGLGMVALAALSVVVRYAQRRRRTLPTGGEPDV